MYDRYWGLEKRPFARQADAAVLAASPVHSEALARLDFLRESQLPFGVLVGPAGSGNTAVLVEFARRAERAGCGVVVIAASGADEQSMLGQLADGLCLAGEINPWRTWRSISQRLAELRLEGGHAVVLLDDLDRAAPGGLTVVERLLGLADAPLTMVASARPETAGRIGTGVLSHAALRIELALWTNTETDEYLSRSLAAPKRQQPIFDAAATQQLFALSGGAPRRVRQLAELALVAGASQELAQIDEQTVCAVHEELSVVR